jgi:hypothetical protein
MSLFTPCIAKVEVNDPLNVRIQRPNTADQIGKVVGHGLRRSQKRTPRLVISGSVPVIPQSGGEPKCVLFLAPATAHLGKTACPFTR